MPDLARVVKNIEAYGDEYGYGENSESNEWTELDFASEALTTIWFACVHQSVIAKHFEVKHTLLNSNSVYKMWELGQWLKTHRTGTVAKVV